MKNKILISIFIFLSSFFILTMSVMGVDVDLKQKWSNENIRINNFEKTSDNGYIVVGTIEKKYDKYPDRTFSDGIILKIDQEGNEQWRKEFGGVDNENFNEVVIDKDNNFIVIGDTNSEDIEGFEYKGLSDCFIVKYNEKGELLWKNSYGEDGHDYFNDIKLSKNNEIYVVGTIEKDNNNAGILLKYNQKDGTLDLEKKCDAPSDDEYFRKIRLLEDGSCIIIGELDFELKSNVGLIVKYDKDLKMEWYKAISFDWLTDFQNFIVTSDGEGIILGSTYANSRDNKCLIYRFNISTGDWIGKIEFDYKGWIDSIVETKDGYIAVGNVGGGVVPMSLRDLGDNDDLEYGAIIIKFDKNWNIKWKKIDENFESFKNIKKTSDGKIYINAWNWDWYNDKGIYAIFEVIEEKLILGDVNDDGKITLADYTKILAHVKKTQLLTGDALKAADVNEDGKVTLADYTKVLAHVKKTQLLK